MLRKNKEREREMLPDHIWQTMPAHLVSAIEEDERQEEDGGAEAEAALKEGRKDLQSRGLVEGRSAWTATGGEAPSGGRGGGGTAGGDPGRGKGQAERAEEKGEEKEGRTVQRMKQQKRHHVDACEKDAGGKEGKSCAMGRKGGGWGGGGGRGGCRPQRHGLGQQPAGRGRGGTGARNGVAGARHGGAGTQCEVAGARHMGSPKRQEAKLIALHPFAGTPSAARLAPLRGSRHATPPHCSIHVSPLAPFVAPLSPVYTSDPHPGAREPQNQLRHVALCKLHKFSPKPEP